jgi:hypothetical protein
MGRQRYITIERNRLNRFKPSASSQFSPDSVHRRFDLVAIVECADADKSLSGGSKAGAGRRHDPGLLQNLVEEFPRWTPGVHPDIR